LSENVEEYLEAIYSYNEKGKIAKNHELAERLKVSPPSISEMIKKLSDEGLVTYEPYKGVVLTGKGTARAQKVVRKHRLLERFLHDGLGLSLDKVHNEACMMEHGLSDEVAAALCDYLHSPKTCPDDNKPIPACTLDAGNCESCKITRESKGIRHRLVTQLSYLRPGETGRVTFLKGGGKASQRIMDMGLCLGTLVKVVRSAPFNGPVEVSVRDTTLAIGRGLAEKIFVEVEDVEPEPRHSNRPNQIIAK
jgi:DtxR family Mn-dependent transcriptional regulator